ncbi:hypothetical protein IFM89_021589 [Coptis chinensis]|uniref:Uncharacterized protein n=1 Tax=Coptis chinensis TaxID=261450 RepID=A0A835IEC9_9MAGN|nr:hypothetical protein IFM89_021589 [Coptis chinensis]
MKALRKEMDSFFEQVIDEHIARRHDDDQLTEFMPKDMLELLLKLADDLNYPENMDQSSKFLKIVVAVAGARQFLKIHGVCKITPTGVGGGLVDSVEFWIQDNRIE